MISNKIRETRRGKAMKLPKNIERIYKEGKCREFSVLVTRMDFAKILGKFTKVKIQYESSSTPKIKKNNQQKSPNSNARLKSNENGMVLIHRNAYTQHPVKELLNLKKPRANDKFMPRILKENSKKNKDISSTHQVNNILKENNRLKNLDSQYYNNKNVIHSNFKRYGIVFVNPCNNEISDKKSKSSLCELLPNIDKNILPSEEWCIDYLPKNGEPKEDKVYDRIAAELEDLMNSEHPTVKPDEKEETLENKDEFPSIMDILNENTENTQISNQNNSTEFKSNLESSDVEAMLLGKSNETTAIPESTQMEVDSTDVGNLMDVVPLNAIQDADIKLNDPCETDVIDNPHSPSILDEALQKGIEEHLPVIQPPIEDPSLKDGIEEQNSLKISEKPVELTTQNDIKLTEIKNRENISELNINTITHVVFKKSLNGECYKAVTCPKNLKYSIEMQGKSVEFLGAPKFVSNLEDLRVLLEIVNDSELDSLYVFS